MNAADECRDQVAAIDAKNTLLDDLKAFIESGAEAHPRHQQVELGPSEVGHPCMRKIVYGLLQTPRTNPVVDWLPSEVGVAGHDRWQKHAERDNARRVAEGKHIRWLTEHRVEVRPGLSGSSDLFDLETNTVIDHKFLGASTMESIRRGPSEAYRRQVHLYGRGFQRLGLKVDRVAIAAWPRGGQLKHAHLWSEPYSDQIVDDTLARLDTITTLIWDLQLGEHLERISQIPATRVDCIFCPQYRSTPDGPHQCNGDRPINPASVGVTETSVAELLCS